MAKSGLPLTWIALWRLDDALCQFLDIMTFLNVAFQASELHSSVDVAASENQLKISFTRIRNAWSGYLDRPSSCDLGLQFGLAKASMLSVLCGVGLDAIANTSPTICSAHFVLYYALIPIFPRLRVLKCVLSYPFVFLALMWPFACMID